MKNNYSEIAKMNSNVTMCANMCMCMCLHLTFSEG
jgi:hypothetical protein